MGRPLNSRYFGEGEGKLAISFFNGERVVEGYIVKQTGTTKYKVTENGTDIFDVDLVKTIEEANNMGVGDAAILVNTPKGKQVATKVESTNLVTESGESLSWTTPDSKVVVEVQGKPEADDLVYKTNSRINSKGIRQDKQTYAGTGNSPDDYQIMISESNGLEVGLAVDRYRTKGHASALSMENGVFEFEIPAAGFWGELNNVKWGIGISIISGLFGIDKNYSDFDITLEIEPDDGPSWLIRQYPGGYWGTDTVGIMAPDKTMLEQGDITTMDQNILNLGWASFRDLVGHDRDWANTKRKFKVTLRVDGVGSIVLLINTDPEASW